MSPRRLATNCAVANCPGAARKRGVCAEHGQQRTKAHNAQYAEVYDTAHANARAAWKPQVEAGLIECRRRSNGTCIAPLAIIQADEPWDLGHPDAACPAPTAPEHRRCNRSAPRTS